MTALGPSDMPVAGRWGQFAPSAQKVLVVDDEAIVVNSIRKILARKGFAVEAAFTCKDALAQVFSHDYDVVLLERLHGQVPTTEPYRRQGMHHSSL